MVNKKTRIALAVTAGLALSGNALAQDRLSISASFADHPKAVTLAGQDTSNVTTWLVKASAQGAARPASSNAARGSSLEYKARLSQVNDDLSSLEVDIAALGLDLTVNSRITKLASGLVVSGSEKDIQKLSDLDSVYDILPVYDYELNVADSAEYIGASAVVAAGTATGAGVTVAVLDSGLDYTHAAVGGPGTQEALDEARADLADTPAWPIGQVLGGYDFFNGDPDPMDNNDHGTSVTHSVLASAPDAGIYIYSVCDQTCPGAAQLGGLEAAMDPNGDGDISDRVDVINMSLGGDFGLTQGGAVADLIGTAVELGVVTVISAGNDGPRPFIVGGPSTTPNAISVGAMTHPTSEFPVADFNINGVTTEARAAGFNPDSIFTFNSDTPLVYSATNPLGCDPFAADEFAGSIALIDRGACAFVDKVKNAQDAGAELVIVANSGPGVITMGGTPAEPLEINSVMISIEDGMTLKAGLAGDTEAATFAYTAELFNLVGAIADFTSRGPVADGFLKPEITAPGTAIDSALAGALDGTRPINGTSFSGPLTAGVMGLLTEALPDRSALELKATLMNTGNLDVTLEARSVNAEAELAPISYIGAGIADADKAAALPVAAWATDTTQAAIAFGYVAASSTEEMVKEITVKNFSTEDQTYSLSLAPRYQNDVDSGALSMAYPDSITVPAGQTITFEVTATLDPSALPAWGLTDEMLRLDEGSAALTMAEFDGALNFSQDDGETTAFHLVYHVLPKAFSQLDASSAITDTGVTRMLTNNGAVAAEPMFLPLTATAELNEDSYTDLVAASVVHLTAEEINEIGVEENFPAGLVWDATPGDDYAVCSDDAGALVTTFVMRDGVLTPNVGGFMVDYDIDGDGAYDITAGTIPWSAFGGGAPQGATTTFTRVFGTTSGFTAPVIHTPGDNEVSIITCLDNFSAFYGIPFDAQFVSDLAPGFGFRVELDGFSFGTDNAYKEGMQLASYSPTGLGGMPMMVDADGAEVTSVAVGESAYLTNVGAGNFIMTGGMEPVVVPLSQGSAPVIEAQEFAIDENTETGTVVGQLVATDAEPVVSPVSEFFVTSSNSVALTVSKSGEVSVADGSLLDHDAGLTEVVMEVVAIDSAGAISAPATVTVAINNLADEPSEQPAPPAPAPTPAPVTSSGGSMGLFATGFMLLMGAFRRRRSSK